MMTDQNDKMDILSSRAEIHMARIENYPKLWLLTRKQDQLLALSILCHHNFDGKPAEYIAACMDLFLECVTGTSL